MNTAKLFDDQRVKNRVCIVTVSFHSEAILKEMLAALPPGVEQIVVDNASEISPAMQSLKDQYAFTYVPLMSNKGFGTACNEGAKHTSREFLLFLNPDASLGEGCLDALVLAMDEWPEASAANPCIRSNRDKVEFKYRSVLLPRHEWLARIPPSTVSEMPALTGGAMLVRREAFEKVGGFDEAIFLYHEDDDLSIRLRQQVGPLLYVPNALVNHQSGHSSGRSASVAYFKAFHQAQSRVYAMKKHGVTTAQLKSVLSGIQGLLNPLNIISRRKRLQAIGFLVGALKVAEPEKCNVPVVTSTQIPLSWKILRELVRPFRQLRALPVSVVTYCFGAWYFDTFLSRRVYRIQGQGQQTKKTAVYVLYAPDGLYESHLVSLNYLVQSGYSVVAVSNAALSDMSRKKLAPLCVVIIERPNFGYDFGAYRQGVLALESQLTQLDSLLLINDSTWFPILNQDWIQQAEALRKDFVGASSNYGVPREVPEFLQDFSFDYYCGHKNFHYCSFSLLIGPAILKDPDFIRFWKRFPLTNEKTRTVRRGEIGLTKWVLKKGFSHCETLNIPKLEDQLQKLELNELHHILQYMIIPEQLFFKQFRDDTLKACASLAVPEAQDVLRKLILVVIARIGISYAVPYFNILIAQSMFLKKSPIWLDQESQRKTLAFIECLESDSNKQIILQEAKQLGNRLV